MARINYDDYRNNRIDALMDEFYKATTHAKTMTASGQNFLDTHDAYMVGAEIAYMIEDEGLMDKVREMYPQDIEALKGYIDMYHEAKK